ncbi:MAG: rhomboid family intramembrane serine protease [Muribaculaceae bacterium]|nr:rhomboid family intramembrane serine protease [Muribaculaceae bacterium]
MLEKWKTYCGGSTLLAWLTLTEVGVWVIVMILALTGKFLNFDLELAEWITLPYRFSIYITRPWTLVSYIAIHFEFLHMLFNVLWLYWFGMIMLLTLHDRHLALSFFGGGICGGIIFLIAAAFGHGAGWLCGCSASVIAVMTVAAIRLPNHRINLFLIGEVKLKWVAVACCVLTFLGGGGNQAAHVGGLIWGIGIGILLRKGIDPTSFGRRLMNSSYNGDRQRNSDKMVKVLQERRNDKARLDELLDKIKISGYESLSRKERTELNDISKRIK